MTEKEHFFSRIIRVGFYASMLYAGYLLVLLSLPYIEMKPGIEFLKTKQLIYHIKAWRWSFYFHVFFSIVVFAAGLLQFSSWIYRKSAKIHRISGYVYVFVLLVVSGPSALVMSFYANGGIASKISFVLLSICWIGATIFALISASKRNFIAHGNWMLRSFALTLSAVSLRFYAYLMDVFAFDLHPITAYTWLTWLSWIPNLLVAEWMISRRWSERFLEKLNQK